MSACTRRRGFDAFVPAPLRSEPYAELHLVGAAADGGLSYLGPAHLAAYGRSGYESRDEASFHLPDRLPRELWLRLGGFAGLRVEATDVHEDVEAAAVRTAVADMLAASATGEVWVRRWTGEALTVLCEAERAFLMGLSERGDVGSVACDPLRSRGTHSCGRTIRRPCDTPAAASRDEPGSSLESLWA